MSLLKTNDQASWKVGGWRARSRSAALMYGTGAALIAVSTLLKAPPAVNRAGIVALTLIAACTAVTIMALGPRYTVPLSHVTTLGGSLLIAVLVHFGAGTYLSIVCGIFLVWVAQYSAVFYSRHAALRHLVFGASGHAIALATLPGAASGRLMAWLAITGTCVVVMIAYSLIDQLSARLRGIVEHSGGVVAIIDPDLTFKYVTGPVESMLGRAAPDLIGTSLLQWTNADDSAHPMRAIALAMGTGRGTGGATGPKATRFESRLLRSDGAWLNTETSVESALHDRSVDGLVLTIRDVTERKALEDQLTHQAFHDPLTGLPNRALFVNRVEHALRRAGRSAEAIAVMMIDLDDFKSVNDTLGHDAGDELLKEVALRLVGSARSADTVGRLGGDEFAVLIEDLHHPAEADEVAQRLLEGLRPPIFTTTTELLICASIGVMVAKTGLEGAADLLRDADTAMYHAKRGGKGRVERFEADMHERLVRRVQLKADMARALERQEFGLVYQPTVSLDNGRIHGVEALLRWQHPRLGLIAPSEFIPVAEESGLIVPIGAWVLLEACSQATAWTRRDPAFANLMLNVNVSGRQLAHPGFLADVTTALAQTGLDPSRLVLEITESILLYEMETTLDRLNQIRALGVRVAIDDFGTGYSSLSYLNRLPIDLIKIDKSFVDRMDEPQDLALVETIIKFGQILGVSTVAEGIEQALQAQQLKAIDCEYGQGFLFARPLQAASLAGLLVRQSEEMGQGD